MKERRSAPGWQAELGPLLQRIALRRDQQALERLYRLTSAPLMGLMMRILHDEPACADLLQELYLKIWYHAGRFDHRGTAWGWLCVSARNAAIDRLRSETQHRPQTRPLDPLEPLLDGAAPPSHEPGVTRCLQQLQPRVRQLILLSYVAGYSHRELQDLIAEPLGSIKSWIRRGLKELKRCLA